MREALPTVSGSRSCDLAAFALLALAIAAGSLRLPVYYSVRVVQVDVARVRADGLRDALPTPRRFRHPGSDLEKLALRIESFMRRDAPAAWREPGDAIEWRVRWSENSLRLDQTRTLRFEGGSP
jgi:hypothetical protein